MTGEATTPTTQTPTGERGLRQKIADALVLQRIGALTELETLDVIDAHVNEARAAAERDVVALRDALTEAARMRHASGPPHSGLTIEDWQACWVPVCRHYKRILAADPAAAEARYLDLDDPATVERLAAALGRVVGLGFFWADGYGPDDEEDDADAVARLALAALRQPSGAQEATLPRGVAQGGPKRVGG